jgi:type VI secretion system protein ImpH
VAAPHQFGFFQAVRLLDGWLTTPGGRRSGLAKLQFRNSLSLSFAPSEIESLRVVQQAPAAASGGGAGLTWRPQSIDRVELTPAFMGLLGVSGTLPLYYTEALAQRELYQKDGAARAFMDVFSHRAVTLFYQAWTKHRLPLAFERDRGRHFLPWVLALAGMGQPGLQGRLSEGATEPGARGTREAGDEAWAFFAGALQQRVRSASQLREVLSAYLGVPVQIEQFVGRWCTLPVSGRTCLSATPSGRGGRAGRAAPGGLGMSGGMSGGVLGRSAVLGERVWQRDMRIGVALGPLDGRRFRQFLPGGQGANTLRSWLTMLCGVSLEYEIRLRLQQDAVRACRLDGSREAGEGRLGWDTFLQTEPAAADRADVSYTLLAEA